MLNKPAQQEMHKMSNIIPWTSISWTNAEQTCSTRNAQNVKYYPFKLKYKKQSLENKIYIVKAIYACEIKWLYFCCTSTLKNYKIVGDILERYLKTYKIVIAIFHNSNSNMFNNTLGCGSEKNLKVTNN